MKNKKLMEILSKVPDKAKVYIESDHGQQSESANDVFVSASQNLDFYGEDMGWYNINHVDDEYLSKVNAVLIG